MLTRDLLHDYQNRGVQFIKDTDKCALWLGLGMGKTLTSLTAIADLSDSFDVSKTLIVAPLRVANTTWHKELKSWEHTRNLTYRICTGNVKMRTANLMRDADIYIINRENIKWLVDFYGDKWPFDMVVIDESSSFKSPTAQRFKALKKVSKHITRMVQLTGTPSPNGLLDLWAQVALLDGGERLGRNMTQYKNRYFEADYMGFKYTPREFADKAIHGKLEDIVLTMKAEDYLDMPDRIDTVLNVEMKPGLLKQYAQLEKDFIAEIMGEDVTVVNAAALANKLLQFANGALYMDETKRYNSIHDEKLDALAELVEENPNENILVAYNYKFDLERLVARFPQAVVLSKSGDEVDQWNDGKIKMLLAHPASAGHGLNLQHGGNVIAWYGLNWSLEYYQQFNGRLHRQGQQKPVTIVHLVTAGTIDEKVMKAIESKAQTQDELLEALKAQF
ncbi:SNF2 family protein [Vibrio phage 1.017.O._10N.286.55.C11]|nr:SNF2 family protein [Vibrio phage 1.017.O._10N.286.55.C11]AUR85495.1 SNF2 family protein [Vibrio phage 1.075.O._10N.286.55.B10]AUR87041.1 SNF2 family protein [Vibrio phage 1.093.O._10N.286.55.E10]AUR87114.1 SNF2 family protein [Vibrio phage 1.094.O._10N.286.55.E12]